MSHNLMIQNGEASMMYVGGVPWHGLGTALDKPATAEEAIRAARLDWQVKKLPLYASDGPESLLRLGEALKQSFRLPANPMKNPHTADEWEPYLAEKVSEHARLGLALKDAEDELNDRVFRLFDLSPAEIALLKKEVEH